jgi:hypothetical protein
MTAQGGFFARAICENRAGSTADISYQRTGQKANTCCLFWQLNFTLK